MSKNVIFDFVHWFYHLWSALDEISKCQYVVYSMTCIKKILQHYFKAVSLNPRWKIVVPFFGPFIVHSEESPVSCDMLCDMDFSDIKPNDASNVKTETRTVTVDQYGSLNCSTKQVFDRSHSVHSTQRPLKALNTTTGGWIRHSLL